MSLRFARRRQRIFRSVVLPPLSIVYYPFTLQIVLLRSLDLRRYLGNFCALYKSFSKIDSQTPLLTRRELDGI